MSVAVSYIQLFQMLKVKIGEKEAEALVEFVDTKVKEGIKDANDQNLKVLATKEDVINLRSELKQDIANLRTELKTDIAHSKTDMIKWIVGFWIVQMAAIIGLYLKK